MKTKLPSLLLAASAFLSVSAFAVGPAPEIEAPIILPVREYWRQVGVEQTRIVGVLTRGYYYYMPGHASCARPVAPESNFRATSRLGYLTMRAEYDGAMREVAVAAAALDAQRAANRLAPVPNREAEAEAERVLLAAQTAADAKAVTARAWREIYTAAEGRLDALMMTPDEIRADAAEYAVGACPYDGD